MTEREPADRLSVNRHSVLVLRLVVGPNGKVTGEIVDPMSSRRERFVDPARLVDAVSAWIEDARRNGIRESGEGAHDPDARSARSRPTPDRPQGERRAQ